MSTVTIAGKELRKGTLKEQAVRYVNRHQKNAPKKTIEYFTGELEMTSGQAYVYYRTVAKKDR